MFSDQLHWPSLEGKRVGGGIFFISSELLSVLSSDEYLYLVIHILLSRREPGFSYTSIFVKRDSSTLPRSHMTTPATPPSFVGTEDGRIWCLVFESTDFECKIFMRSLVGLFAKTRPKRKTRSKLYWDILKF